MGEIKRRHALCLMGVFCLPLPAVSAHRTDSIRNLGEVVVKAKTYKEVIPAQTLKGEELRKLNSFSVADAIRYFSGLQIKDYGGVAGLKTVNIRSMGTNHTGVYYNGIQLGNAQNGQVDLGKFSLDNIEEISLYNGQKSDIFQSAREFGSSGSIYLTTRRPRFKGEKDANLAAKVKFGSYGLLNPALLYEHKISDKISAAVSAEWITSQGDYNVFDLKQKTATFSDGDPGTLWMWSLLFPNGLPIDISGKISDTKIYCTLDLTFGTQIIHVTFGKDDFESSIHSTWAGKQTETTNVYTLQGMRVKSNVAKTHALDGLQKGIYIVDGKKVIKE